MKSPEAAALDLVAKGAILKTFGLFRLNLVSPDASPSAPDNPLLPHQSSREGCGLHPRHFLVGDLRWLGADAFFWFTAHGDRPEDGHVLAFDSASQRSDGGLTFRLQEQPIATLSPIERADVSDVDDYRIAFSLWRESSPVVRPFIDRCYERCAAETAIAQPAAAIIAS